MVALKLNSSLAVGGAGRKLRQWHFSSDPYFCVIAAGRGTGIPESAIGIAHTLCSWLMQAISKCNMFRQWEFHPYPNVLHNTSARDPMASGYTGEAYVYKLHEQMDFHVEHEGMG